MNRTALFIYLLRAHHPQMSAEQTKADAGLKTAQMS